MKNVIEEVKGKHIHFVGIKGTGMIALVELLVKRGAIISGSDVSERFYTDEILEKLGIKALPFSENNITSDISFTVYSSAYNFETNSDLKKAKEMNIPCLKYTEALGLVSTLSYSVGICGVHGKTTTTGITGTVINALNLNCQTLAGSIIKSFNDSCIISSGETSKGIFTKDSYFVAETCEYQRHFMDFRPSKIVLTSVESDHQDFYPTFQDIQKAFVDYALLLPENGDLIYCADDKGACDTVEIVKTKRTDINLIPYGESISETEKNSDFKIDFLREENKNLNDGTQIFSINKFGKFKIAIPGHHSVLDAAAAIAVADRLLEKENKNPAEYKNTIQKGLMEFKGAKRRSEIVGTTKNIHGDSIIFIDDYGHHPTAVKTTLEGYRNFYKGRKIIVSFMSHTYTRTMALMEDFAKSFGASDIQIIHKIYGSARESFNNGSEISENFFNCIKKYNKNAVYFPEILSARDFAAAKLNEKSDASNPNGYLFVTMGAGDNWKLGKELLK